MSMEVTRYRSRVNPKNRRIDIHDPSFLEQYDADIARIKDQIGLMVEELMAAGETVVSTESEERWGSPELARQLTIHGLAVTLLSQEMIRRGIGWPLQTITIQKPEGIEEYTFIDDETVPVGNAIIEVIGEE